MKVAIMQPYLFPYIGYWQLINAVDQFVIFDDVNFIKKGFIQKNSILLNNNAYVFNLELQKASQNKLINQIEIGGNSKKILKTIYLSYKKAPYFYQTYPVIENILNQNEFCLSKFIGNSLIKISEHLDLNVQFIYSSHIKKDNALKSQEKIINICKKLNAKIYINSIGGKILYDKKDFDNENINLKFLKSDTIKYKQYNNDFIPNLSVIDVLMFNNIESVKLLLNKYS
ncbi:MAG: WbqC family protein, partial [Ignavibacteriae bacterium]|nr:WbqC family protein [Ignavibacteriota bacterium]